jgi:hypothetical protein
VTGQFLPGVHASLTITVHGSLVGVICVVTLRPAAVRLARRLKMFVLITTL